MNFKEAGIFMLKVGDWVTQYSSGYWQIVDIKPKYADEDRKTDLINYKKGDLIGSWILMKKGFTSKMKFRVDSDVCDSTWCKIVSDKILDQINEYFEKHPQDYETFISKAFIDRPAISTTYLKIAPEQLPVFKQAIKDLPKQFTYESGIDVFKRYGVEDCFSKPPSNYIFVCEHTLWEIDDQFNPLYKNPKLIYD